MQLVISRSRWIPSVLIVVALVAGGGIASQSLATVVAYNFEGVVKDVTTPYNATAQSITDNGGELHNLFGDLSALSGKLVSGSFSYDTTASETPLSLVSQSPYWGLYEHIVGHGVVLQLDGKVLATGADRLLVNVTTKNISGPPQPADVVWLGGSELTVSGQALPQGSSQIILRFQGDHTDLPNDSIPTALNLTDWQATGAIESSWQVWDAITFEITSLTPRPEGAVVPGEPITAVPDSGSTFALLIMALPGFALIRSRWLRA